MKIEKTTNSMTQEEIEQVIAILHPKNEEEKNTLDRGASASIMTGFDEVSEISSLPHAVMNSNLQEATMMVEVNPITGINSVVGAPSESLVSITDISNNIDEDMIADRGASKMIEATGLELSEEDANTLFEIVTRMKSGEKVGNLYNIIPHPMRDMVDSVAMSKNPKVLSQVSKELINFFMNQMEMDDMYIDLQQSIQKELNFGDMSDIYIDQLQVSMESELLKKADTIEAQSVTKGSEELKRVSEELRRVSEIYTNTYNCKELKGFLLVDTKKKVKTIIKNMKKYNKQLMEFHYMYKNTKFNINSIDNIHIIVAKHLDIDEEQAKWFILLFTLYCKENNLRADNVFDHTFMYYTVKHVLYLDHSTKEIHVLEEMKSNISEIIHKIYMNIDDIVEPEEVNTNGK